MIPEVPHDFKSGKEFICRSSLFTTKNTPSWGDGISDHLATRPTAQNSASEIFFFKMAAFVVQVHNVVDEVIRTSRSSDKDTNEKIDGELMQPSRAVVKKHTLSPMKAYKYHLAQPSRMLSRSVVHWKNTVLRRLTL